MSKRGIIGRVAQLARANVSAVIDSAENPQQAADQLARDYATTIAEADQAIAQLAGNRRIAADDQLTDVRAAEMWADAAAATSQTADELRAAGDAATADRFDDLARVALARQLTGENDIEASQHTIAAQIESVETLTNGLGQMQIKLSELTHRRDSLATGSGRVQAQTRQGGRVIRKIDVLNPASEGALFQEMVRREQARIRAAGEAQAPPSDAQLAGPDSDEAHETEIEERLKALKTGRAMASALARAHDQPFR